MSIMSIVSIFAAPSAGFLMDKFGLIVGVYYSASMIAIGQFVITVAALTHNFGLMICGRFLFGCGFEPMNSAKSIIMAKWF